MLERLSPFHNSVASGTDMNVPRHSNFCPDRLLSNDNGVSIDTSARLRDYRQNDVRHLASGVGNPVFGCRPLCFIVIASARIEVPVESGEVTARDLEANAVAGSKVIASRM